MKCIMYAFPSFELIQKNGKFKKHLLRYERWKNNYSCFFHGKIEILEDFIDTTINSTSLEPDQSIEGLIEYIEYQLKLEDMGVYYYFRSNTRYYCKKKTLPLLASALLLEDNLKKESQMNKKLAMHYRIAKLYFPSIKDKEIFIQLFYAVYVPSLIDEIEKKHGVNITLEFENYHETYKFLKKKGYVDYYFKTMVKETINALPEIDHWIDKNVKKFREEIKKKAVPYKFTPKYKYLDKEQRNAVKETINKFRK